MWPSNNSGLAVMRQCASATSLTSPTLAIADERRSIYAGCTFGQSNSPVQGCRRLHQIMHLRKTGVRRLPLGHRFLDGFLVRARSTLERGRRPCDQSHGVAAATRERVVHVEPSRASSGTTLHIEKLCLVAITYARFIVRLCNAPACKRVGNVLAKPKPLDRLGPFR